MISPQSVNRTIYLQDVTDIIGAPQGDEIYIKKNQSARYQKLKEGNQGYTQETNNMKNICRCEPSSVITHL